mgnify:FL=1
MKKNPLKIITSSLAILLEIFATTFWMPLFLSLVIFGLQDVEYTEVEYRQFYTIFTPYVICGIIAIIGLIYFIIFITKKEKIIKYQKITTTIFVIAFIALLASLIVPLIMTLSMNIPLFTNIPSFIYVNWPIITTLTIYICLLTKTYSHSK